MSLSEKIVPMLSARAATDPTPQSCWKMFTRAEKMLNDGSMARIGDEMSTLFSASNGRLQTGTQWLLNSARSASKLIPAAFATTIIRSVHDVALRSRHPRQLHDLLRSGAASFLNLSRPQCRD